MDGLSWNMGYPRFYKDAGPHHPIAIQRLFVQLFVIPAQFSGTQSFNVSHRIKRLLFGLLRSNQRNMSLKLRKRDSK